MCPVASSQHTLCCLTSPYLSPDGANLPPLFSAASQSTHQGVWVWWREHDNTLPQQPLAICQGSMQSVLGHLCHSQMVELVFQPRFYQRHTVRANYIGYCDTAMAIDSCSSVQPSTGGSWKVLCGHWQVLNPFCAVSSAHTYPLMGPNCILCSDRLFRTLISRVDGVVV